jgi:serine/threonine protein kinase
MSFLIGQTIGDYVILQELGHGGAGRVYKVEHTITRRREAMKVLAAGKPSSPDQAERFLREIRLQASLDHPNIAAVHNAFWAEDDLVLICELLEGESLRTLLERGRLPLREALDIISQTLSALSYAHGHGVIHRDVSPANILVTAPGGRVKLIDFGLAKAAADLRITQEGSPAGSLHYMSPEQVRGTQTPDARTDIYGCGAVLYELATGRKPFDGDSAFAIMQAQAEQAPKPPQSVEPGLPAGLNAIILQALAKAPEERFQSADSFGRAVEQLRKELGSTASQHRVRHLRAAVGFAWVMGLFLTVGVAGGIIHWGRRHDTAAPAPAAAVPSETALVTNPVGTGSSPALPAKPLSVNPRRHASTPASAHAADQRTTGSKPQKSSIAKIGGAFKHLNPFRRKETHPSDTETP